MKLNKVIYYALIGIYAILLVGCTTGPNFERPNPPNVSDYTYNPLEKNLDSSTMTMANTQLIVKEKQLTEYWWKELGAGKLEMLISEALEHNPNLVSAEATLRKAREQYVGMAGSTRYPKLWGNLGGQHQRFNPGRLGQSGEVREFDLYSSGVSVRYTFDFTGGNRRALEALAAKMDYQRFQLEGARLSLVANIVSTTFTRASLKQQLDIINRILKLQEEQLKITQERVRLGNGSSGDISVMQRQLGQTRAELPVVLFQLQQNEHLLAVLIGRAPGDGPLPSFTLEDFTFPSELPLLIPSELVRARPDILAAEALLEVSNAEYGVAISNLYPSINLSADLGSEALSTGALFGSGSAVWSFIGQLTQPLFDPGLPAEKRAALASLEAAAANYQSVVLEALQNVADVLRASENDLQSFAALSSVDNASEQYYISIRSRYELGKVSYNDLLVAEQIWLRSQLDLVVGRSKRLVSTVAFYKAMGGGLYKTDPLHTESSLTCNSQFKASGK